LPNGCILHIMNSWNWLFIRGEVVYADLYLSV